MRFENPEFLIFIIIPLIFTFFAFKRNDGFEKYFKKDLLKKMQKAKGGLSKNLRVSLLLLSLTLVIISLARPVMDEGEIKVKKEFINTVVAIDISKSMFSNDIYPNRFEFAKRKFYTLLDYFKNARIAVIGFSSKAFLISPLTDDFNTLKYLVKNMRLDYVTLKGTDILEPLKVTDQLLKNGNKKALILFTDGGDQKDFSKEIEYAKKHRIKVFVYAVATEKGGVIKDKNGIIKDKEGNIVVTKLNPHIKELALKSGGDYVKYSYSNEDIKSLVNSIQKKFKSSTEKETTIKNKRELFYYPLLAALILFLSAISSLPSLSLKRREK